MIPGFIASSTVSTTSGPLPIEAVKNGSKVQSRLGYKRVSYTDVCEGNRRLVRASDGRLLIGAMNALAWVKGRGWRCLWQLADGDVLTCADGANIQVSDIKEWAPGATYALSVDKDPGYFANGILVR